MKIKEVFGYCACEGCKNKYDIVAEVKDGKKEKRVRICCDHAEELINAASRRTATVEHRIEF